MASDSPFWYVSAVGKQPSGPFTAGQIIEAVNADRLQATTLCWREGMPQWLPLAQVEPFAGVVGRTLSTSRVGLKMPAIAAGVAVCVLAACVGALLLVTHSPRGSSPPPDDGLPTGAVPRLPIGLTPPMKNVIRAILPGSAAAKARPPLIEGDKIIQANGVLVEDVADLERQLAGPGPERTLTLKIVRPAAAAAGGKAPLSTESQAAAESSQETVYVGPNPMRVVGLAMGMGKIVAIEEDSPAEQAGLQADDFIQAIGNEPPLSLAHHDPLQLRDYFRRKVNEVVRLKIERASAKQPLEIRIVPRQADCLADPLGDDSPVSIPEIGIAYRVLNRVQHVAEKSPAAAAGVKPGDIVTGATLLPPDLLPTDVGELSQSKGSVKFDERHHNWPLLMAILQRSLPGTTISLELEGRQTVTVVPVESADWFNPHRGFLFETEAISQAALDSEATPYRGALTIDPGRPPVTPPGARGLSPRKQASLHVSGEKHVPALRRGAHGSVLGQNQH